MALGDEIMIVYDYGHASNFIGADGEKRDAVHATKCRALPVQWFYESKIPANATEPVTRPDQAM